MEREDNEGGAGAAGQWSPSGVEVRNDATTWRMALLTKAASFGSERRSSWVAPATVRCRLLDDRVAILFWAEIHPASLPLPAVRTIRGVPGGRWTSCPASLVDRLADPN